MKDTRTLSLGRETLLSFASNVVMAAIGFGGTIVFARVLGPDGLGVYKTAIAVAFVLTQVPAGTGTAIKKRVSEVDVDPGEFFGLGLLFHGVFSLAVVAAYVLFRPFVDSYFASTELAVGAIAVVLSLGLFNVVNRMYSGMGYPSKSSWIDTVRSVLTLTFQLLFIWRGFGPLGLVAGFVVATFLSALVTVAAAGTAPQFPGKETLSRIVSFARWSVSNSLLDVGYGRADVLLLNGLVGSSSVGFYTAALQLSMPGNMFGGSIQDSLAVKSSGLSSVGDAVRTDLENAMSYAGLISIPILFGAIAIPTQIMTTVFGPSFAAASTALVAMAAYQALRVYRLPFEAVAEGTDNPDMIFRTNILVFVVYAPLAVLLGLEFGLLGVISGSIFGEVTRVAAYQVIARRWFGGVVLPRPIFGQVGSAALMSAVVGLGVQHVVAIRSWLHLGVVVTCGAAIYFGALLAVSSHFRHTAVVTIENTFGVELAQ